MVVLDLLIGLFRIEGQNEAGRVIFAIIVESRSNAEHLYAFETSYNRTLRDAFLLLIAYLSLLWLKANTQGLFVIDVSDWRQFEYIILPP